MSAASETWHDLTSYGLAHSTGFELTEMSLSEMVFKQSHLFWVAMLELMW
jgi:hypothetical protein